MRLSFKRLSTAVGLLFAAVAFVAFMGRGVLVQIAERFGNPVSTPPPYQVEAAAQGLHARLFVADLHADTLLSARDARQMTDYGQIDLPRLRAGRVSVQVFSIVTNMPPCGGFIGCHRYPNLVVVLAMAQGWPTDTWISDKARALYQAAKLRAIAAERAAGLMLLQRRGDLLELLSEAVDARRVGAVLGIEGAQALGDDISGVDEVAVAGVRVLGLAHYFDNQVSGSAHGVHRGGLSKFGRLVVQRAGQHGMLIDLAHASRAAINDFLNEPNLPPFIVSHTGLRSICDTGRNLEDAQVQRIVAAGGIIGIGAWGDALCLQADAPATRYVERMAETIRRTVVLADREHPGRGGEFVALGSDFDGWVPVGFDASGWPLLTEGLLRAGLGEAEIAGIMGGNVCRLLLRALPGNGASSDKEICLQEQRNRTKGSARN